MLYLNEHDDGDEQMDSYKFPALGKASSHAPVFLNQKFRNSEILIRWLFIDWEVWIMVNLFGKLFRLTEESWSLPGYYNNNGRLKRNHIFLFYFVFWLSGLDFSLSRKMIFFCCGSVLRVNARIENVCWVGQCQKREMLIFQTESSQ